MPYDKLSPDAIAASTNLTGAVTAIDEDPASPDANWLTATSATAATDLRVTFPTPTLEPSGEQTFSLWLRKTAGIPNPTVNVSLYQGGALRAALLTNTPITSTTGQLVMAGWNSSSLASVLDGSNVECRVESTPGVGGTPGTLPAYSAAGTLYSSATIAQSNRVLNSPTHAAGDLLIALVCLRNTENNGFLTSVNGTGGSGGWTLDDNGGNMYGGAQNARIAFGWKIATSASEVCSITTMGGTTTARIAARVYRFTAADGFATPALVDVATGTTGTLGAAQDMTMPTVAAGGAANALAVCLYGISVSSTQAAPTGETGGDWTEPVAEDAATNGTTGIFIANDSDAGGLSGGTSASGATSGVWINVSFHLVPANTGSSNVNTVEVGAIGWCAGNAEETIFGGETLYESEIPPEHVTSATSYNLGMRFSVSVPGTITKIRWYAMSGETGNHSARLYDGTTLIGGTTYTVSGTGPGWIESTLPTPISVIPGVQYTVAVTVGSETAPKHFAFHYQRFIAGAGDNGRNITWAASPSATNADPTLFPSSVNTHSYFRDIVFAPTQPVRPGSGLAGASGAESKLSLTVTPQAGAALATGVTPAVDLTHAPEPGSALAAGSTPDLSLALAPQEGLIAAIGASPQLGAATTLTPDTGQASASGDLPALNWTLTGETGVSLAEGAQPSLSLLTPVELFPESGAVSGVGASPELALTLAATDPGIATALGDTPQLATTLPAETGQGTATGGSATLTQDTRLYSTSLAGTVNLAGAFSDITDNPDVPDASWLTAVSPTLSTETRIAFADPALTPNGAQAFRLWLRKTAGAPNPTVTISLYQNGVSRAVLLTDTPITSETGQIVTAPWNANQLLTILDGSDVECHIVSTPGTA